MARECHDVPTSGNANGTGDATAAVANVPARPQIVLAGNPNVGKTTLFNALTGFSAKVSNYPGITVERRTGTLALRGNVKAALHDLPGTYSVNARSSEERRRQTQSKFVNAPKERSHKECEPVK